MSTARLLRAGEAGSPRGGDLCRGHQHRTAQQRQLAWQICQPALGHLTSKLCALTCACKHASLHVQSRTSTRPAQSAHHRALGFKVTCQSG
ncbi:hypothetical protein V8C34DRAFT_129767 [Trichoderma compactum]